MRLQGKSSNVIPYPTNPSDRGVMSWRNKLYFSIQLRREPNIGKL